MKKEQVTHISHNPQPQSLALPPKAKLPLESDPVLKKKFQSALKLAGSSVEAPHLATDKNLFDTHALLSEHPFSHSVKKNQQYNQKIKLAKNCLSLVRKSPIITAKPIIICHTL